MREPAPGLAAGNPPPGEGLCPCRLVCRSLVYMVTQLCHLYHHQDQVCMKQVPRGHEQNLPLSPELACTSMPDGCEFPGTFLLPSSHALGHEDFPDSSPHQDPTPNRRSA